MSSSNVEGNCLRQGDILDAVPFPIIDVDAAVLGRIDADAGMQIPHPKIVTIPREHRAQQDCFTMQIKTRLSPGAVLSHCCELELRNGKCLLPMIAVARITPIKASTPCHRSETRELERQQGSEKSAGFRIPGLLLPGSTRVTRRNRECGRLLANFLDTGE